MSFTPAGWYPDPSMPATVRYWDGAAWSDHVAPTTIAAPAQAMSYGNPGKQTGIAYLFVLLLGGVGAHHFYLGRIGSAVTYLVLFVIGTATASVGVGAVIFLGIAVWWIIDLCLIPGFVRKANGG